jgi:hypothetical protein
MSSRLRLIAVINRTYADIVTFQIPKSMLDMLKVFQFPDRIKTVAAESIIAEVFHAIAIITAVKIDIAGGFPVFVKRVQEVAPDAPLSRNIMLENVQSVICQP